MTAQADGAAPAGGFALSALFGAGVAMTLLLPLPGLADARLAEIDGYAHAPAGAPQMPGLLRRYAARPPWRVAGVDYAVGVPRGTRLKDPAALALPGISVDPARHLIHVAASNVTLDGFDFSLAGGWGVHIQPGAANTVISRSNFRVGANNVVPVTADPGAGSLAVLYSTFDGGGAGSGRAEPVWTLIAYNGSGRFVAVYDWFGKAPADAIDFSDGRISVAVEYNVAVSLGHARGAHPDFVQFVGSDVENSVIAFNTIYQPPGDGAVSGMQGIQVTAQTGTHPSTISGVEVLANTILAPGPVRSMSCAVAITESRGNRIDGVDVRGNYLDFRGAYFPFYPPSGARVTFSGNIDMATGRLVFPSRRR